MANDYNPDYSPDFPAQPSAAASLPATGRWDKLSIINEALTNTSNDSVTVPDDGSDEWKVASSAYEQWLLILMADRNWKSVSRISTPLGRVGRSDFPGYCDVFAKPADCMHLMNVWRLDLARLVFPSSFFGTPSELYNTQPPALDYQIIGDQIHTVAQCGAVCQYVPFPNTSQPWSTLFVAALRLTIEAACYRSLNEDYAEGNRAEKAAAAMLDRAAAREDSEEPRKVAFNSTMARRRRTPRYGSWGGR